MLQGASEVDEGREVMSTEQPKQTCDLSLLGTLAGPWIKGLYFDMRLAIPSTDRFPKEIWEFLASS